MSESGLSSFIQKNKIAILATLGVTASALSAYYILQSQSNTTSPSTEEPKKTKKKSKKKSGNGNKENKEHKETTVAKIYPIDSNGEPKLTKELIDSLSSEDKDKYSLALKEDGNEFFKNKDFTKAIKFYSAALDLVKDPVFYSNRSACYVGLEDYEKVVEDTTAALELKPDYTKCLLRRSNAYEQLEKYEDSMYDLTALSLFGGFNNKSVESVLDRVLKKHSLKIVQSNISKHQSELPSASSISSFFGAFEIESKIDGINEDLDSLKKDSGDYFLIKGLGSLNNKTRESFINADSEFSQAINAYELESKINTSPEFKNKYSIALEYSGAFKFLKNEPLNAILDFQKSLELHPRSRTYIYNALIAADKQDFTAAHDSFSKAIELSPESSEIYYHQGQMYYLTAELTKAKECFEKAKQFNPENVYSYIQLACIEYRDGNHSKADELFTQAKKHFPTNPDIPNYYGEILADKGDLTNALKQFEISFKLQEALPQITIGVLPLVNKAAILAKQPTEENLKESITLLEKAVDLDPKNELSKITLAQLKLQSNKVEEAIKLFEESSYLARSFDEKLQATSFAEASKIQLRLKNDPVLSKKLNEIVAQYGAQELAR
ncbi:Mitochondrial import receptor subunit tom-70 [Wickerhamomyces ciferrii]|uniref:Mitochondrial import receptor subunit tom-70 n=1 Tax=Wickerhamomyces ciferrii (strain ATCC 14091 / BCRC 22168 / CBS 111 / JCM 3599 / NBRC 0793 / NRRL Y-1031 F-60-10) TaxID=1206466 RepID=K0KF18_WICCF|nr:Mitochondrial import receptor subunit tom-70 [Wickerhamomyces ciferrii]CCH40797.1 Mitochondrial import receptor subunit tom-70 [Wickerhamomyces ciferrii]